MRDQRIEEKIPSNILNICRRFYEAGEDAYVVGGSLRDIMLGRTPSDFDLATSAAPQRTSEIFSDMRVIETGIKHGTVTVIADGAPVEITTFRIDGDYTDSRHPNAVSFTKRIEEDLSRRDFTVNAMAYNDRTGLVDPFSGQSDLDAGIIRAVGDPQKRFSEDALRIMRAFRFSAQLGFAIDGNTLRGAIECRDGLSNIAKERIFCEFSKLLCSASPSDILTLMAKEGVLSYITNEYVPKKATLDRLERMPNEIGARLGFFLSDTDKEEAEKILRSMKVSNALTVASLCIVRGSKRPIATPADARRLIGECGVHAKNAAIASALSGLSSPDAPRWVEENRAPCSLSELEISGRDLMALGARGKDIGRILNILLSKVLEDPAKNDRDTLQELAKNYLEQRDLK